MYEDISTVIKDLSLLYDKDSKDTFISAYINRLEDKNYLRRRIHTCESLLDGEEKDNFRKTIEVINGFLEKSNESNIAVFASKKYDFFKSVTLPMNINNSLVVDSSPYIRPLARIQDEWESFSLIVMNSNQAKIYAIELGKMEKQKNLSSNIMNKHKKGGWSQARFQRIRKGAIHEFYLELIDYIQKNVDTQMILAGPGTAKMEFKELLPTPIAKRIVEIIDSDMDEVEELFERSINTISKKEDTKAHRMVKLLMEEILKSGLAVYGHEETLDAARNGQIDVLIVEKDYQLKGCLCEHCQILKSGPVKDCPVCGNSTTEADMIEEIIEFAERTDATVEFTDDEEISRLGHIAGLLRFKLD